MSFYIDLPFALNKCTLKRNFHISIVYEKAVFPRPTPTLKMIMENLKNTCKIMYPHVPIPSFNSDQHFAILVLFITHLLFLLLQCIKARHISPENTLVCL